MGNFLDKMTDRYKGYFKGVYVNKLKNIELAIKVLIVICTLQFMTILLMINYVVQASIYKEVNVQVNKENLIEGNKYVFEKTTASRNAFENSAYGVLHELTSFDYTNIEKKSNWILSMVHPDNYDEIYRELTNDSKFSIENRVNQKFDIKDWKYIQVNKSTAKITAKGNLIRTVGGVETIKNEKYEASVVIEIKNYLPFIVALELNYNGKEKKDREIREKIIENYDRNEPKGMKDEKIK